MSRFYFSYFGNKRTELSHIYEIYPIENFAPKENPDDFKFTTVVEPFSGSSALSLDIYNKTHLTNPELKFIVNDTDKPLITVLKFIKEQGSTPLYEYCQERLNKEEWKRHNELIKKTAENINNPPILTPYEHFYTFRVRGDFGRLRKEPTKWPSLTRSKKITEVGGTDKFYMSNNTTILLNDWRTVMNRYKDDPEAFIFLDPPYFSSFNQEYYNYDVSTTVENGIHKSKDITGILTETLEYMKTSKATIVLIINSCAIIDYIFKGFIKRRYNKTYASPNKSVRGNVRNATDHLIISNSEMIIPRNV